jgi:hypothetical protein
MLQTNVKAFRLTPHFSNVIAFVSHFFIVLQCKRCMVHQINNSPYQAKPPVKK